VYRFGQTYKTANAAQRQKRKQYGYVGRGSYRSIGGGVSSTVPRIGGAGTDESGSVVVSRTEYIKDIFGTHDPFKLESFELNPGLEGTFSLLSQIAQNYEEYEMIQLMFHYVSTTTDPDNSKGQCGTIIMGTNNNPSARNYGSKQEMLESAGSTSTKTTMSVDHGVECDPRKLSQLEGKYIRSKPVQGDIKEYDHGNFQIAMVNLPDEFEGETIGELWVSYTVKLRKPRFFSSGGYGISQDIFAAAIPYVKDNGWEADSSSQWMGPNLLSGKNNSIGSKLYKLSIGNEYALEIPKSWSGNVEVVLALQGPDRWVNTGSLGNDTTQDGPVSYRSSSNISTINDMYCGTESATGATDGLFYKQSSATTNGDPGPNPDPNQQWYSHLQSIAHFEVKAQGSTTEKSAIYFSHNLGDIQGYQSQLIVREYNAGSSYKRNLRSSESEAPMMQDAMGNLQSPP